MQENIIARKYAKAIERIASAEQLQNIYEYYSEIGKAFFVPKFNAIIYSHIVSRSDKLNLVRSFVSGGVDKLGERLLELLAHNDRISLLPFVILELKKILDSRRNTYEAVLYFKESVDADSIKRIENNLSKRIKVDLHIRQEIDSSIDGIKLEIADLGIEVVFLRNKFIQDLEDSILKAI